MSTTRSTLGWGIALVALGTVLLLRNLEVVASGTAAWPWAMLAAGLVLLVHPGARRAGTLALPLVLTILGGVFALRELGALPGRVPLVPVLLVVVGVALLATAVGTERGSAETEAVAVPLGGATSARLVLAHGAGTLRVTDGAAEGLLCQGSAVGGVTTETRRTGERAEVTIRHRSDLERLLRSRRPLDWELAIPGRVPVALEVRTGASQVRLDLSRTAVDSVTVKAGASDVDLILPASGRCRVRVDAGAADVEVRVPPGVAAGIRTRSALASVDVDEHRFPRNSDGYRSADYDGAEHRADIELEGGVASFSVR